MRAFGSQNGIKPAKKRKLLDPKMAPETLENREKAASFWIPKWHQNREKTASFGSQNGRSRYSDRDRAFWHHFPWNCLAGTIPIFSGFSRFFLPPESQICEKPR